MATFRVERCEAGARYPVVMLETDDGLEAEVFVHDLLRDPRWYNHNFPTIRGTHPSHVWESGRCVNCGGWDNGSYGSHFPCGFDFEGGKALVVFIERWKAEHAPASVLSGQPEADR